MARTLPKEERERLVLIAGKLAKQGMSIRNIVAYFQKNENISLSPAAVSGFLKTYKEEHFDKELESNLKNKRGDITDENVAKRVLVSAELCLKGYTLSQISEIFNVTYNVTYNDLTSKIEKFDKRIANAVALRMKENSMGNLKNQFGNEPNYSARNQERDELGRFTKKGLK